MLVVQAITLAVEVVTLVLLLSLVRPRALIQSKRRLRRVTQHAIDKMLRDDLSPEQLAELQTLISPEGPCMFHAPVPDSTRERFCTLLQGHAGPHEVAETPRTLRPG